MPYVPLEWLAEYTDIAKDARPEDVAAALVKVGLEEEGIIASDIQGPLVVGRVISVVTEEASNGKSINYCRVDVGEHNDPAGPGKGPDASTEYPPSRGIVCGAHNFSEGDYVVVVLPGAELPGGFAISARKTYGHISDGMICSVKELGIGDDHEGILVLATSASDTESLYEAASLTPGDDVIPLLGLDAVTLEINVTPDRGYCFSMRGVAREYSHATEAAFRDPCLLYTSPSPRDS